VALEGSLKDFALPDIFQLIGLQKKTGVLTLRNESDEVTIGFKDGHLVSADSGKRRLEDRLGTMLVRSGLITDGQLHDVLEKQKQTLQRMGVVLVNEGLVRKDDLKRALELQVTQLIYRVFRWEDAQYNFDQDAQVDFDREFFTPIGAESVLMEGMRILDEWPIVEKVVRSMQLVYERVAVNQPVEIEKPAEAEGDEDDFDFDLGSAKASGVKTKVEEKIILSQHDGAVYKLLDGKRTVEDVMYLARVSEFDTCKAIYDLLNRDLIREVRTAASSIQAKAAVAMLPAEASPAVVAALYLVLLAAIGAGAWLHRLNPLNGSTVMGFSAEDIARQDRAAVASRLDRTAHALEAHRLAFGTQRYSESLEELIDAGYVRSADIRNPEGLEFDYTLADEGIGFTLQAYDAEENAPRELQRVGGAKARE
jgi:hypothetical protein